MTTTPRIEQTAFHEACHCAVGAKYAYILNLKILSANEREMKKIDPDFRGGLLIERMASTSILSSKEAKAMLEIAVAGMCGDTIKIKGKDYVEKNFSRIGNCKDFLFSDGASQDYKIAMQMARVLSTNKNQQIIIFWDCVKSVLKYLMTPEVEKASDKIAQILLNSPRQSLKNKLEVLKCIRKSGLNRYLRRNYFSKRERCKVFISFVKAHLSIKKS